MGLGDRPAGRGAQPRLEKMTNFSLVSTSKCTDLARPRTGGAPFAAERCADFQRAAERRLMVTPLSAWEGRKRRFAYRILSDAVDLTGGIDVES